MEVRINITEEESKEVERLFFTFNGYCNILGYLTKYGSLETNDFDKKWDEAVEINSKLERLKESLDRKYHPQDNNIYEHYEFDFLNHQMVYIL